jgi:hypothetical protein
MAYCCAGTAAASFTAAAGAASERGRCLQEDPLEGGGRPGPQLPHKLLGKQLQWQQCKVVQLEVAAQQQQQQQQQQRTGCYRLLSSELTFSSSSPAAAITEGKGKEEKRRVAQTIERK